MTAEKEMGDMWKGAVEVEVKVGSRVNTTPLGDYYSSQNYLVAQKGAIMVIPHFTTRLVYRNKYSGLGLGQISKPSLFDLSPSIYFLNDILNPSYALIPDSGFQETKCSQIVPNEVFNTAKTHSQFSS
jgi:hypothetical protein